MAVSTEKFKLSSNALVFAFENQSNTNQKALGELIQNSIDAQSSEVHVKITGDGFSVDDNGSGFKDKEAILAYFKRVAFNHDTEIHSRDGYVGSHGMGRLQTCALAKAAWRTNVFRMSTDIKNKGHNFDLESDLEFKEGCEVSGEWYKKLSHRELTDVVYEVSKMFEYSVCDVFVNGRKVSINDLGEPTIENEFFSFWNLADNENTLTICNVGTFVKNTFDTPYKGIVISKKALRLNTARTSILENECSVWRFTKRTLDAWYQKHAMSKLAQQEINSIEDYRFIMDQLERGRLTPNQVRNLYFIPAPKGLMSISPAQLDNNIATAYCGYLNSLSKKAVKEGLHIDGQNMALHSVKHVTTEINKLMALCDIDFEFKVEYIERKFRDTDERKEVKKSFKTLPFEKLTAKQKAIYTAIKSFFDGFQDLYCSTENLDLAFCRNIDELVGENTRVFTTESALSGVVHKSYIGVDNDNLIIDVKYDLVASTKAPRVDFLQDLLLPMFKAISFHRSQFKTIESIDKYREFEMANSYQIAELLQKTSLEAVKSYKELAVGRAEKLDYELGCMKEYQAALNLFITQHGE